MPNKPKKPCKHNGCHNLVEYNEFYCEEHKALHKSETKREYHEPSSRSSTKRGYNSKWQKARLEYLQAHPLCVKCKANGRYVRATVVDHIEPHCGNQKLFWDRKNWQPLCKHCHDVKTMTEDREQTRKLRTYSY